MQNKEQMLKNKLMLYPQTATVNHSYIEGSLLVDKVLKKHLMILEKSNLELTEKKVRLQQQTVGKIIQMKKELLKLKQLKLKHLKKF